MKPGFDPGVCAEVEVTVTPEMQAAFDGKVIHRVYSTWSMVEHMEHAARKVLEPYLEPHEEGVGHAIHVTHLAPAPVGETVRARAVLERVEGNRIICRVEAWCGETKIGEGTQVQVVLPKEKLERLLAPRR